MSRSHGRGAPSPTPPVLLGSAPPQGGFAAIAGKTPGISDRGRRHRPRSGRYSGPRATLPGK